VAEDVALEVAAEPAGGEAWACTAHVAAGVTAMAAATTILRRRRDDDWITEDPSRDFIHPGSPDVYSPRVGYG
jgi:hypothetical protein